MYLHVNVFGSIFIMVLNSTKKPYQFIFDEFLPSVLQTAFKKKSQGQGLNLHLSTFQYRMCVQLFLPCDITIHLHHLSFLAVALQQYLEAAGKDQGLFYQAVYKHK